MCSRDRSASDAADGVDSAQRAWRSDAVWEPAAPTDYYTAGESELLTLLESTRHQTVWFQEYFSLPSGNGTMFSIGTRGGKMGSGCLGNTSPHLGRRAEPSPTCRSQISYLHNEEQSPHSSWWMFLFIWPLTHTTTPSVAGPKFLLGYVQLL